MKATTSGLNIFRWTTPNMGTGVSFWGEREADRTGFDKERNGDLCARGGEPSAAVGGPARHWRPRGGPGAGALENQFEPARGPSLGSAAAAAHGSLLRRPTAARPTSSHHRRNTTTCRRRRHRRRRRRLRSPSETTAAAARPKSCPSSTIPVSWVAAFFLFVCKPKMHTKKTRWKVQVSPVAENWLSPDLLVRSTTFFCPSFQTGETSLLSQFRVKLFVLCQEVNTKLWSNRCY